MRAPDTNAKKIQIRFLINMHRGEYKASIFLVKKPINPLKTLIERKRTAVLCAQEIQIIYFWKLMVSKQ